MKDIKTNASQEIYETIQAARMDDWIDSERVREFDDTTQEGIKRFKHESIHTESETFWNDSDRIESIQVDTRHKWKGTNMNSYKLFHWGVLTKSKRNEKLN